MILRPQSLATSPLACLLYPHQPAAGYSTTFTIINGRTRLRSVSHPRCLHRKTVFHRPSHRSFSSSSLFNQKSHYDILGVDPGVSPADLKKRFYVLSKETHPDVNPNNPNANERFAEVSEAYTILGNEEKRKKYDRDVMPQFRPTPSRSTRSRSGSYAGSRPATGLSKRRGTFRGPPPSFYSQGTASPEEQARRDQEAWNRGTQAGQFDPSQYASPGAWDLTFNPTPVYKTQAAEDTRRQSRRQAEMAAAQQFAEEESHFWAKFVIVSGIVGLGALIGTLINRMSQSPRGGLTKGDGTRRLNGDIASR